MDKLKKQMVDYHTDWKKQFSEEAALTDAYYWDMLNRPVLMN